jgi:hypothetical protein
VDFVGHTTQGPVVIIGVVSTASGVAAAEIDEIFGLCKFSNTYVLGEMQA